MIRSVLCILAVASPVLGLAEPVFASGKHIAVGGATTGALEAAHGTGRALLEAGFNGEFDDLTGASGRELLARHSRRKHVPPRGQPKRKHNKKKTPKGKGAKKHRRRFAKKGKKAPKRRIPKHRSGRKPAPKKQPYKPDDNEKPRKRPEDRDGKKPEKPIAKGKDGKWKVCVPNGKKYLNFGKTQGRRPTGIRVWRSGKCEVMEYAGGFDGYFSTDAGDGHEDGLAEAVKQMLGEHDACVGERCGRRHPANHNVNKFMKEMLKISRPKNYDFPEDEWVADNGGRMDNIKKVSDACTEMITVEC